MPVRPTFLDPNSLRNTSSQHEVVSCEKCGCEWMELIMVQQYKKHHSVILGQKPPSASDIGFYIFKCPKCSETYEPQLTSGGPQELDRRGYGKFIKQMRTSMKKPHETTGEDV